MVKEFNKKWFENKNNLEKAIRKISVSKLIYYNYGLLMKLIIKKIINKNASYSKEVDARKMKTIDYGDYQGALIFVYPAKVYKPSLTEIFYTTVSYGSCPTCDAILNIIEDNNEGDRLTEKGIEGIMQLCLHMIQNTHAFKEIDEWK